MDRCQPIAHPRNEASQPYAESPKACHALGVVGRLAMRDGSYQRPFGLTGPGLITGPGKPPETVGCAGSLPVCAIAGARGGDPDLWAACFMGRSPPRIKVLRERRQIAAAWGRAGDRAAGCALVSARGCAARMAAASRCRLSSAAAGTSQLPEPLV